MTVSREEFERVYRQWNTRLLAYLEHQLGDPELAADVMADVFLRALAAADGYRGGEEEFEGWLWTTVRSVLSSHRRHNQREQTARGALARLRIECDPTDLERIEELAANQAYRDAVARKLDELPRDQREAIRLRIVEGLSYEEVARRMHASETATRTRVSRASRTLRALLGPTHRAWRRQQDS